MEEEGKLQTYRTSVRGYLSSVDFDAAFLTTAISNNPCVCQPRLNLDS